MFALPNEQLSLLDELRLEAPELSDRDAVIVACERLLREAEAEPPISVELLASLRGIVKIVEQDQPWSGVLAPTGNGFLVSVRASDGYERQRFTICHETAHTFFPGFHQARQFRCNERKTRLEQLCDAAASELLLPRSYFNADLEAAPLDFDTIEELSAKYEASIEATALRLVDLSESEPLALLALRERHKPAERGKEDQFEPRLRLDYCHSSGRWPFAPPHKSVDDDSPLVAALNGEYVDTHDGNIDELFSEHLGHVEIHARRYGNAGRVLALIRLKREEGHG
jgi:hypothetical protein